MCSVHEHITHRAMNAHTHIQAPCIYYENARALLRDLKKNKFIVYIALLYGTLGTVCIYELGFHVILLHSKKMVN